MTLEEFKEIKKKILDDIKTRQRNCEDETWGVYYSIEISGVMELARAVEEKFKKSKEIVGTTTMDKALEKFLLDNCPEVKKKLKALEVIKEKEVDLGSLLYYIRSSNHPLAFYNKGIVNEKKKLTKDEFDLLWEVFK